MGDNKATKQCPCGFLGDPDTACRCSQDQVQRYQGKLSGPLLDRFDLSVALGRVRFRALRSEASGAASPRIAKTVAAARARACVRQGCQNARLPPSRLMQELDDADAAQALLERAAERLHLSARACHRIIRVARTVADLAAHDRVHEGDMAEALSLRVALGARAEHRW